MSGVKPLLRERRLSQVECMPACSCVRALIPVLMLALATSPIHAEQSPTPQAARAAMEAKDYAAAETIYRQLLIAGAPSPELLTDLGLSLQLQGRSAEAIHSYSLALRQKFIPETYALLAEERCRMGELDTARPMLARIYREQRNNPRVVSAVASCYLESDEPIESAVVYRTLIEHKEFASDLAIVQLGKSYIRSGQFFAKELSKTPGAEPFLAALRKAPDAGSAGARGAFEEAARVSPYFRPDLDWISAVNLWRQHPKDVALLYLLSVLSAEEGMREIESCESQFPASPYLQQFYADVLADQGHGDEAVAQYEELVRKYPDLSEIHYSLGLLREKRQEWAPAADAFRQQLATYPNDERAAAHLSKCMLQMQQYAAVREFLQPKIHAAHPPEWASLGLAEAEQKLGNSDKAIQILVAAEHAPESDKAVHYRLMRLYAVSGRLDDAKRELALFEAASKQQ